MGARTARDPQRVVVGAASHHRHRDVVHHHEPEHLDAGLRQGSSSTATASSANAPCNGSHRDRWDCSTGVSMTCAMRAVWHAIGARAST